MGSKPKRHKGSNQNMLRFPLSPLLDFQGFTDKFGRHVDKYLCDRCIPRGNPLSRPPLDADPAPVHAPRAIRGCGWDGALAPLLELLVVHGGPPTCARRRSGGDSGGRLSGLLRIVGCRRRRHGGGLGRGSGHRCRQRGVPRLEARRHLWKRRSVGRGKAGGGGERGKERRRTRRRPYSRVMAGCEITKQIIVRHRLTHKMRTIAIF